MRETGVLAVRCRRQCTWLDDVGLKMAIAVLAVHGLKGDLAPSHTQTRSLVLPEAVHCASCWRQTQPSRPMVTSLTPWSPRTPAHLEGSGTEGKASSGFGVLGPQGCPKAEEPPSKA